MNIMNTFSSFSFSYLPIIVYMYCDKSSAVAETGDRFATIDTGRKVGAAVPLSGRGGGSLVSI